MRIMIGSKHAYSVDRICPTARDGKRALREHDVTVLYLDYFLGCRDTGADILKWALQQNIAPPRIVLVTNKPDCREDMGRTLITRGYRTVDGINYQLA